MAAIDIAGTVRERAARELRDRILTGALPAGSRIDLDAITEEFATSRTPVREALLSSPSRAWSKSHRAAA